MPHVRARIRRRGAVATLVTAVVTLLLCALLGATAASAAAPSQGTTSTTAPAALPTTTNAPLPQSGMDSATLAGLAVSSILIGCGACSFSRGVRLSPALRWADRR